MTSLTRELEVELGYVVLASIVLGTGTKEIDSL